MGPSSFYGSPFPAALHASQVLIHEVGVSFALLDAGCLGMCTTAVHYSGMQFC